MPTTFVSGVVRAVYNLASWGGCVVGCAHGWEQGVDMSVSPVRVGYLGPAGTFTLAAAERAFGRDAEFVACDSIESVFDAVNSGRVDEGVVPVENSTDGAVRRSLDCFVEPGICIRGEVLMVIRQCLVSCETSLGRIERVLSHSQGLGQCRKWLQAHLPEAKLESVPSTGVAAKRAAQEPGVAAIGSRATLDVFDLHLLAADIHDNENNQTRFWVIGKTPVEPTGRDKTALWFSVAHEPGALYTCLRHFSDYGVNLTRIESRPAVGQPWEYLFFIEMEGHHKVAPLRDALLKLAEQADEIRIMGSYPQAPGAI